jgi:hypothetical protein
VCEFALKVEIAILLLQTAHFLFNILFEQIYFGFSINIAIRKHPEGICLRTFASVAHTAIDGSKFCNFPPIWGVGGALKLRCEPNFASLSHSISSAAEQIHLSPSAMCHNGLANR